MVNEYILSQLINENEKEVFFMRAATINQSILQDASFRRMNAMNQIVSSTFIDGRVLQNGYKDSDFNTQDSLTAADVDFGKAELKSTKLKAMCKLYDDDKEDNIEREAFEQTLVTKTLTSTLKTV